MVKNASFNLFIIILMKKQRPQINGRRFVIFKKLQPDGEGRMQGIR